MIPEYALWQAYAANRAYAVQRMAAQALAERIAVIKRTAGAQR